MREVWAESSMVQRWLDVEAAIALAESEVKIIPRRVAATIAKHCNVGTITPEAIAKWYTKTGHVIVSMVKAFRDVVPEDGELFHYGPTTQDILDTGLTLQIRDALCVLIPALEKLIDIVIARAVQHKKTVMAGRSEGQIASPITFGYKLAVLATELADHLERLAQCSERLLWLSLFGAVGVQSSFCQLSSVKVAQTLTRLVGERLKLRVPPVCVHHRTDRFGELGTVIAGLVSTLGETGLEIRDLQRSEVGEVSEPWDSDRHSSSTMPQKQNPEMSEWLEGLASLSRAYAISLLDIQQQHERDITRLPAELEALPNLFLHAIAAIHYASLVYDGLRVFPDRMLSNLTANGNVIMSEAVMLLLAARSKRKVWAHQLCHNIALSVSERGGDLVASMSKNEEVLKYLSPQEIRAAADPARYIGTAWEQVDASVAVCKKKQAKAAKIFARTVFCA